MWITTTLLATLAVLGAGLLWLMKTPPATNGRIGIDHDKQPPVGKPLHLIAQLKDATTDTEVHRLLAQVASRIVSPPTVSKKEIVRK